jgi:hypothetical protein
MRGIRCRPLGRDQSGRRVAECQSCSGQKAQRKEKSRCKEVCRRWWWRWWRWQRRWHEGRQGQWRCLCEVGGKGRRRQGGVVRACQTCRSVAPSERVLSLTRRLPRTDRWKPLSGSHSVHTRANFPAHLKAQLKLHNHMFRCELRPNRSWTRPSPPFRIELRSSLILLTHVGETQSN